MDIHIIFKGQQLYWDPKSEFAEWFDRVTDNPEMAKNIPYLLNI